MSPATTIKDEAAPAREKTRPVRGERSGSRLRTALAVVLIGLFVFVVGAKPNWFGWDRSPVVGFVQITVFLFGLAIICLGGYFGLLALWDGSPRTILADIGMRLVGTGLVIAVFSGMADVFGMGSQPLPEVPYFGPWQATGVLIGQVVIALGFLMMMPYGRA
jgi:hypothetical protein